MFNYLDRQAKVEPNHLIGGERPAKIFFIGRYEVTMFDDGELTYKTRSGYHGSTSLIFPNMEIEDGILKITVEDIVDQILQRIEPEELAVALWVNKEVRQRFMDALSERWSEDNIGDSDRRAFISKVKEQIHSVSLDNLASKMSSMEYKFAQQFSVYQEVGRVNQMLEAYDCRDRDGKLLQAKDMTNTGMFSIGGEVWNEAREHWRKEIMKNFEIEDEA